MSAPATINAAAAGIAKARAESEALLWPVDAIEWEKDRLLGAPSGQAAVFKVKNKSTAVVGAFKYYKPIADSEAKIQRAFMRSCREVAALQRLSDSGAGIVRCLGTNVNPHQPDKAPTWMVSELVDGGDMAEAFLRLPHPSTDSPLDGVSLAAALAFAGRLCESLQRCSEAGVVHRDLKPENILLRDNWTAAGRAGPDFNTVQHVLCDFGISWIANTKHDIEVNWEVEIKRRTELGHALGNTFYRVPQLEQMPKPSSQAQEDELQASRRSDKVDACGVCAILFWLLTGIDPVLARDKSLLAPHQRAPARDILAAKVQQAANTLDARLRISRTQLGQQLLDTLDRGFEDRAPRQWILRDLATRIVQMQALLEATDNYVMPKDFSRFFSSMTKALKTSSSHAQVEAQRSSFHSCAIALTKAKKGLVVKCADEGNILSWVGSEQGKGYWTDKVDPLNKTCRDILQYGKGLHVVIDVSGHIIGNEFTVDMATQHNGRNYVEPLLRITNGDSVNPDTLGNLLICCFFKLMRTLEAAATAADDMGDVDVDEDLDEQSLADGVNSAFQTDDDVSVTDAPMQDGDSSSKHDV